MKNLETNFQNEPIPVENRQATWMHSELLINKQYERIRYIGVVELTYFYDILSASVSSFWMLIISSALIYITKLPSNNRFIKLVISSRILNIEYGYCDRRNNNYMFTSRRRNPLHFAMYV